MSRRKGAPQSQREKIENEVQIECTGIRTVVTGSAKKRVPTHSRRRLDVATLWPDGSVDLDMAIAAPSTPGGEMQGITYPFRCDKCGKDLPLRESTLKKIVSEYVRLGRVAFDISAM